MRGNSKWRFWRRGTGKMGAQGVKGEIRDCNVLRRRIRGGANATGKERDKRENTRLVFVYHFALWTKIFFNLRVEGAG